jgi:superkiller protein 3
MRFGGKTLLVVCLSLVTVQLVAQDYQAQIDALKAQSEALYKKMEEAPDKAAYDAALEEYNQVKAELEALIEKATAAQNSDAQAKIAFNQGGSLLKQKQYAEAIKQFDKAIEIDPKYDKAYYMKGYALTRLKDYPEAIAAYEKVLQIAPNDSKTIFALGKLYEVQGEGKKAIQLYDNAVAADPANAKAAYSKGAVYLGWQAYSEAVNAFSQAASMDSTYSLAYTGWGTALIELGKVTEAIEKLNKAAVLDPKNDDALYRLAKAYNAAGDYTEALTAAEKAISLAKSSRSGKAAGQIEKGNALEGLGKKAEAKASFEQAAQLDKKWKEWVDYHIEKMQ